MTRITNIADLHNLPFTPEARLPHPCDLARWHEQGFYRVDANAGRFVLTDAGRKAAEAEERAWDRQAEEARDEFRKVTCILPVDRSAHPASGRVGEY